MTNTIKSKSSGFTIVELLIVIVVIAILAAISIVAYNGIQNSAKTSTAEASGNNVVKKVQLYNTAESSYPADTAALTGATADKPYRMNAGEVTFGATATAPTDPKTVTYTVCATGSPATNTGATVQYWNYSTNAQVTKTLGTC